MSEKTYISKGADFVNEPTKRKALWRIWDENKPIALCIGLNPSKANQVKDDATIVHLVKMLYRLGFGGLYMTNLYTYVSSNPKVLTTIEYEDPVEENLEYITTLKNDLEKINNVEVIFAWGAFKQAVVRANKFIQAFPDAKCLGKNTDGSPAHPLAMMYAGTTKNPQLKKFSD